MSSQYLYKNEFLGDGPGQIPMAAGQWDILVRLGELPGPDQGELYSRDTIDAVVRKLGWVVMSGGAAMSDWCRDAVGRHSRSQADIFSDTLAALEKAERLDAEEAEVAFNKKVEAHIAKMRREGKI